MDPEIKAMNAIGEALSGIEDADARRRVLRWANEKFGFSVEAPRSSPSLPPRASQPTTPPSLESGEMPGVAILTNGELRLTVRDVKARSAVDAGLRLIHIAIRAHEKLTGQKTVSSKSVLVPLLKSWRVYDGNLRAAIAKHKGIIRNGDFLELDYHAQKEADRYIEEVLDGEVTGTWNPVAKTRKKRGAVQTEPQN